MSTNTKQTSGIPAGELTELLAYAAKAPSGHNTQPWKFRAGGNTIEVLPRFELALPVVDGNYRELYISLGCAVENLCIAASHFQYDAVVTRQSREGITIGLTRNDACEENPLFRQVAKRQTNRSVYTGKKISGAVCEALQCVPAEEGVSFYLTDVDSPNGNRLAEWVFKGNEYQMGDPAFKNELLSWMRFNARQSAATNDGLVYHVFGNPPLPRFLAKPIVSLFLKPDKQNKADREKIRSSSHFVLFTCRTDTPGTWINTGRTLQRFLLRATETGIACAYLNQPCETPALAEAIRRSLPVEGNYPAVLLRIGYAEPVSYSPRREIKIA
ncbi:MAG: nitroreductase [Parabacteroides sp.]|nr:nitroreductase [Parabacteroides sp.]